MSYGYAGLLTKMRKYFWVILTVVFVALGVFTLNIEVGIQQCINYQCHVLKMPLYLKLLDFFDRHYNYKYLVKAITKGAETDEEKAMQLFTWTYKNIKKLPAGFPVMDDHIWYTIIRGYGVNDQFCDIFTTLCNYAGIEAFFTTVYSKDKKQSFPFSFVKINGKWTIVDSYHGIYFRDKNGAFAQIDDLRFNNWSLRSLDQGREADLDYVTLFSNLPSVGDIGLNRSNIQSPLNRLFFEIEHRMGLIRDKKQ